ncbi:MAG: hypothetical protein JNM30_11015 [Rhodospirillales bacterium]|nr:hypothetical protein [Rhodospirillales bacterium]
MITNFIKLTCSTLAFGMASAAIAVTIAVAGLWLVDAAGGKQGHDAPQVAEIRTGAVR